MRRNVMVFSGGAYPGIEIYFALRDSLLFKPILASSYSDHSSFVCPDYLEGLPFTNDPDFAEKLNKIIDENNIEFILPTHDTIALTLMENADRLHAVPVCSCLETAKLCRRKSLCYEKLHGTDLAPKTYSSPEEVPSEDFPVFVKPDEGQGTVGAKKAEDYEALKAIYAETREPVICEFLPGDEFTVDCFTNAKGELVYTNPRSRSRVQYGISARAISVKDSGEFYDFVSKLNDNISFRGYWFAQLKRDNNGKLKLLEICTRFAGTFNHAQGTGVNLPLMALCDFAGMNAMPIVNNYSVTTDKSFVDRYRLDFDYSRVYVDYDDTITAQGGSEINPYVMAYLYDCRRKHREIILLTRHTHSKDDNLLDNMKKLAVPETLFDEIIELDWNDKKADKIKTDQSCILLDNSFAERLSVSQKLGIPVFDVCHVSCLFDWS